MQKTEKCKKVGHACEPTFYIYLFSAFVDAFPTHSYFLSNKINILRKINRYKHYRKAGYGHYTVFVVFSTGWFMYLTFYFIFQKFLHDFNTDCVKKIDVAPGRVLLLFSIQNPFVFIIKSRQVSIMWLMSIFGKLACGTDTNLVSWLGIAAMVSLMGPILFGIHRFSYYYKINDQTSKSKGLCSFGNCSWYIFGAMVNQGGIHLPAADSGRLAVAFWWIFQIITVTTYSGNLVAFLTFPKQENPFDNIANLRSSNLKWASIKQSSLEFLGAQAKEGILKEIYTTSKFYEKNDESKVISNVRNQKEVFFYDRVKLLIEQANDYDRNGHCGLEPSTTILSENPIGLAVPAHSPSLKLLNTEIRKMLQGGLVDKWKRKYWPGENACTMKKTAEIDSNRTVTLSQIYGSYYVLAIGFGAGIIMLLAEYVSKKYRNKTNRVQSIDIRQELAIENMTRVHF
ncbi:Ionotropic receptor 93a [Nymphon striatum]|nr:Ionotropic receptor 93a [Nymphon striatum]